MTNELTIHSLTSLSLSVTNSAHLVIQWLTQSINLASVTVSQ